MKISFKRKESYYASGDWEYLMKLTKAESVYKILSVLTFKSDLNV